MQHLSRNSEDPADFAPWEPHAQCRREQRPALERAADELAALERLEKLYPGQFTVNRI